MKLKYAMFEQKKNKLMTVLIFFQIVIVFIMLVSIMQLHRGMKNISRWNASFRAMV